MEKFTPIDYRLLGSKQGRDQRRFGEIFFRQFEEYGFALIQNPPIDLDRIRRLYAVAREFFRLPEETKRNYVDPRGGYEVGWTPYGLEVGDMKEFFHVGRPPHTVIDIPEAWGHVYRETIFPREVPGFEDLARSIYSDLDIFALHLLECLDGPLGFSAGFLRDLATSGKSTLRILWYPPTRERPLDGSIRAKPHGDINLITILVPSNERGLQILRKGGDRTVEADWIDFPVPDGCAVVNAGDMLAWMTTRVPSTIHRVVNPSDDASERMSLPFFCHPAPHRILRGAGGRPDITAHDALQTRLRELGLL